MLNTAWIESINNFKVKTNRLNEIGKVNFEWLTGELLNEYDSNEIDDNEVVNVRTSRSTHLMIHD